MGGAVLLHALARHPSGWVDGLALLAPAVWNRREMPWYQRAALGLLAHTWPGLKVWSRRVRENASDNVETLRRLREDPLVIQKTRVDVLWGAADLMDAVTTEPVRLDMPMLVLYGASDQIIPPRAICAWVTSLERTQSWQFAVYPRGWHLLTRGLDAANVHADLAAWLDAPGAALPSNVDTRGAPFCADH